MNNLGLRRTGIRVRTDDAAQEHRRNIPLVVVIRNDGDGFAVALGNDARLRIMPWRMEGHPVAHHKALHLLLHARLLQEAQACNDFLIELRELGFTELGDVGGHGQKISDWLLPPAEN